LFPIFRKLSLTFAAYFSTYMLEIQHMINIIVVMIITILKISVIVTIQLKHNIKIFFS